MTSWGGSWFNQGYLIKKWENYGKMTSWGGSWFDQKYLIKK